MTSTGRAARFRYRRLGHAQAEDRDRGTFPKPGPGRGPDPEVLYQLHIEAAHLKELEGLVSLAHGLELEAIEVIVTVVGQLPEYLTVVEEVL